MKIGGLNVSGPVYLNTKDGTCKGDIYIKFGHKRVINLRSGFSRSVYGLKVLVPNELLE